MIGLLRRLARDRRGVSAVEFALIAPAMIAFYFGLAEMTQATMADRRNAHVASAVGDLVAQSSQLTNANMTDIFAISQAIIAPFPTTTLGVRVTSVTVNSSGVGKVDWCDVNGSGLSDLTNGATFTLPTGLVPNGESIIIAESVYSYDSPVHRFIPGLVNFTEKLYLKPRKSSKVLRTA